MKVSSTYYDENFDFSGQWGMPSKCGLKIIEKKGKTYVIVTELYQDNPGTSVTQAGRLLRDQICAAKGLQPDAIVYLECTPDTNSVLSFYDEQFFEVIFNDTPQAQYRQLSNEEVRKMFEK